MSYHKEKT